MLKAPAPMLRTRPCLLPLFALAAAMPARAAQAADEPLRIFIRAGQKTHGPGEHDAPAFLAEWRALLAERGAKVEGALRFPTAAELDRADVLIVFKNHGGDVHGDERARLERFVARGGGVVVLHDGIVSDDPHWWKTIAGGAWQDGRAKFQHGQVGIYVDPTHPITDGMKNHFLDDEIYWDLHFMPGVRVLANGFHTVQDITPQVWIYEGPRHRAFVSLQGHKHATFSLPHHRALVLRGIAWAGRRPADSFTRPEELAQLAYPPGGPMRPEDSAKTIRLHPEFRIGLVAAEPDVINPVQLDWDPAGRLWVAEIPGYPVKAQKAGIPPVDRLVILEDRDGDGRADARRVFCDGLDLPAGFVLHRDGAIVVSAPDITFVRDTDGDGVCDRREPLFSGFGYFDTHAVASNLRWGMDGWIYGDQGYSGGASNDVRNAAGKSFGKIGNGVFRFRPDGSAIEQVSSFGGNTWGIDFDWDGELFVSLANGPHLRHVLLPEPVLARGKVGQTPSYKDVVDHHDVNPILRTTLNPYVQVSPVGAFTAACGPAIYRGGAWPMAWWGLSFVTEPMVNLVHVDVLRRDGPSVVASKQRQDEFLAATDLWFRPVAVSVGPDGALYVADLYSLSATHNDIRGPEHDAYNAAVRPDRDHTHGRIWRVQHRRARTFEPPGLDRAPPAALARALAHDNRWRRMTAHRLLAERGAAALGVVRPLLRAPRPETRVHALWLLARADGLAREEIARALGDRDAGVRRNAAHVAAALADGTLGGHGPADTVDATITEALMRGLADRDPRARLEAIVALGATAPTSARVVDALVAAYPRLGDDWSRSAVAGALRGTPLPAITRALAGPAARMSSLIHALSGVLADGGAIDDLLVVLAAARPAATAAVLEALARLVEAAPAGVPLSAAGERAVTRLLGADPQVAAAALPLAVGRPALSTASAAVADRLLAAATDPRRPPAARVEVLRGLARFPPTLPRLRDALPSLLAGLDGAGQRQAIAAMGDISDPSFAAILLARFAEYPPATRDAAVAQILRRGEWTQRLLDEIEGRRFRPQDLGPANLFRLRHHPDKALAARARSSIDAVQGAAAKDKDALVAELLPVVQRPGDRARGRVLLEQNCLGCHQFRGAGKDVGPDLTTLGARGPAELLLHIVDPNRSVDLNHVSFDVTKRGGETLNGIVARETATSITLRNASGDFEIKRADVKAMVSSGASLMPEGFEGLGAEALRDLLAALCFDEGGFRTVDILDAATASTRNLYGGDERLRLLRWGRQDLGGTPFDVPDPATAPGGNNAIVLRAGERAEVKLGYPAAKLHLLGGIAATGAEEAAPAGRGQPILRARLRYADGANEDIVLSDGVEFAHWSRRVDVPGSRYVAGFSQEGVKGQVRRLALTPGRQDVPIASVTFEALGAPKLPTILALTAELPSVAPAAAGRPQGARP